MNFQTDANIPGIKGKKSPLTWSHIFISICLHGFYDHKDLIEFGLVGINKETDVDISLIDYTAVHYSLLSHFKVSQDSYK